MACRPPISTAMQKAMVLEIVEIVGGGEKQSDGMEEGLLAET